MIWRGVEAIKSFSKKAVYACVLCKAISFTSPLFEGVIRVPWSLIHGKSTL